jgi:hypothetical protein
MVSFCKNFKNRMTGYSAFANRDANSKEFFNLIPRYLLKAFTKNKNKNALLQKHLRNLVLTLQNIENFP